MFLEPTGRGHKVETTTAHRSVGKAGDHTVDPEPVKPAEHGPALGEVHHHEGRTQPVTRSAGEVDRRGREP